MKVYLSPSGQIHNEYAYGKYTEAQVCRMIASKLSAYLSDAGISNRVAEPYANDTQWKARCTESDKFGATYHIPIHTNAGGGHGVRVFTSKNNRDDKVAKAIFNSIYSILPSKFRNGSMSVKADLYEINAPKAKTIYIECAFHDNKDEAKWIVDNIDTIAKAIFKGITGSYPKTVNTKLYRVQVGAFKDKENADTLAKELTKKGYNCIIKED